MVGQLRSVCCIVPTIRMSAAYLCWLSWLSWLAIWRWEIVSNNPNVILAHLAGLDQGPHRESSRHTAVVIIVRMHHQHSPSHNHTPHWVTRYWGHPFLGLYQIYSNPNDAMDYNRFLTRRWPWSLATWSWPRWFRATKRRMLVRINIYL